MSEEKYDTTWHFNENSHLPKKLSEYRSAWFDINDRLVLDLLSSDEQYLDFQKFLLLELRSKSGKPSDATQNDLHELSLGIRAGAVRSIIQVTASIVEAALRHRAEQRHHKFDPKPTLNVIIEAWDRKWFEDIRLVRSELGRILEWRNTIHLFAARDMIVKSAKKDNNIKDILKLNPSFWRKVNKEETSILSLATKVLNFVKNMNGV